MPARIVRSHFFVALLIAAVLTVSMEYVTGKPSVAVKPSDRETRFSLAGNTLTITFSNGSVQTFRRTR